MNTLTTDIIQYPDIANAFAKLPDNGSRLIGSINSVKTNYANALNDVNNFIPPTTSTTTTTLTPTTTTTTTTLAPTTTTRVPLKKYKITGNSINKANSIDIAVNTSEKTLNDGYSGIEACERQCDIAGYNCTGFSFNKTNNTCTLYSKLDTVVNDPTGNNDIFSKEGTTISKQPDISQYQNPIKNMTGLAGWMVGDDGTPLKTNKSINDPNAARGFTGSDACKYVCNNVDNCAGFVFDNNAKLCTLYSNLETAINDNTNTFDIFAKNGTKVVADKVYSNGNVNVNYPSNDIGTVITNVADSITCQIKCNETDNCEAYVYNATKKECNLKTNLKYGQPATGYQAFYDNKGKPENRPALGVYNVTEKTVNIANRLDNIIVNTSDLTKNDGYNGYEACERQCDIADNTCAGFSYDKTTNACSLYSNLKTAANDPTGKNDLYSKSGTKVVYDKGYSSGNVNINYPSNDIGNTILNVTDAISCQIKCNETDNCDAFVYNETTKECKLKTDLKYGQSAPGYQAFYDNKIKPVNRSELGNYYNLSNKTNNGDVINSILLKDVKNMDLNGGYTDLSACKFACDSNSSAGCVGFSFDKTNNSCIFYSNFNNVTEDVNKKYDLYAKDTGKTLFLTGTYSISKVLKYTLYTFTNNGTITFPTPKKVPVLIVGGGGSGGTYVGGIEGAGGGGAGGLGVGELLFNAGITYNIVIGIGGKSVTASSPGIPGTAGSLTSITGIDGTNETAYGGGYGAAAYSITGLDGGSGGGGMGFYGNRSGGNSNSGNGKLTYYGNNGGIGSHVKGGGGGGGAGGAGELSTTVAGAAGGSGFTWEINNISYAGGGGGGSNSQNNNDNIGGAGSAGSGNGGSFNRLTTDAMPNTGSGGGGGGANNVSKNGGSGGSGVVIIAIPN